MKERFKNLFFLLPLILTLVFFYQLQGISPEIIIEKVQEKYKKNKGFQANFVQESLLKSLGQTKSSYGLLYFKNPDKIRWDYQKPKDQQIVSDGKTIWFYKGKERQVFIKKASEVYSAFSASTFLSEIENLKKDFKIKFGESDLISPANDYLLTLVPHKPQANLSNLLILVDHQNFLIKQMVISDLYGNLTTLKFHSFNFNSILPDAAFVFNPPPGTEVITSSSLSPPS